jgi:type I restriction enzyme S subunit
MEQQLYELPEGWEWNDLGSVTEFKNGFAFKSKDFSSSGLPILRISNIQSGGILFERTAYFPEYLLDDKTLKCFVEKEDVVIAMSGATTGKVAINNSGQRLLQNQRVGRFLIPDKTLRRYVYLFLSAKVPENLQKSLGAAQPNLSTAQIKGIKIPLPPLNEQKRIIAKLDALFTRIDTAITHLQQTLELSKALFSSAYTLAFDEIDAHVVELGSIVGFFNGFAFKGKDLIDDGLPVLRISNIQRGGIDFSRMAYFPEQKVSHDIKRFYVEPEDIVIAMSGATTGKVGINDSGMRLLQNQRVGRFVIKNEYTRKFVYQFLSIKVEENLQQALGAAQPNLSTKQIKEIKIPIPPLEAQKAIVSHLDSLTERIRTLESATQEKLSDLTALKASLLDAAFKGQL